MFQGRKATDKQGIRYGRDAIFEFPTFFDARLILDVSRKSFSTAKPTISQIQCAVGPNCLLAEFPFAKVGDD